MKTQIINNTKAIILALVLVAGVGYVSAAWTVAPANPPSGNTDAPINVSSSAQVKTGDLTIPSSGILSAHNLITRDFTFDGSDNSSIRVGKVLTAVDSTGRAAWVAPAALNAVTRIIAGKDITINPAGGTGDVTVSTNAVKPVETGIINGGGTKSFGTDWKLIQLSGQQNVASGDAAGAGGYIMKDANGNVSWSMYLGQSYMNNGTGDANVGLAPNVISIDVQGSTVSVTLGTNVKLAWVVLN